MKKLFVLFVIVAIFAVSATVTMAAEQITFDDLNGKWEGFFVRDYAKAGWGRGTGTLTFSKKADGTKTVTFNDNGYLIKETEVKSIKDGVILSEGNFWSLDLKVKKISNGQIEIDGNYTNTTPGRKTAGQLTGFKKK